jgi:hypothetical protein
MSVKKVLLWGSGLSALVGGILYGGKLKRLSKQIQILPSAMLHKVDLTGIYIRVDALVKNPTNTTLNIKYPFVKISYRDTDIGSSQAKDEKVSIKANSDTLIPGIMIQIPLLSAFSLAYSLYRDITSGLGAKMKVNVLSTLLLGIKMPYNSVTEITLKKEA